MVRRRGLWQTGSARSTACEGGGTRLLDAGCDVVEAAAITGCASLKELQRYIEMRDRKRAARRAMHKLISGTEVSNPVIRFDKEAKKA